MTVATGTATSHNDLIAKLRTFLTGIGWTSLQYTAGTLSTDVATCVLRAPGATVGDEFYLFMTSAANVGTSAYGIEIRGGISYNSALPFAGQTLGSPAIWLNLWQNAMPYWFIANGRHVKIVAKVSSTYISAYCGLFLPYALPVEYPKPFYVGANYNVLAPFDVNNTRNRFIADPGELSAYYLNREVNAWIAVQNQSDDTVPYKPSTTLTATIWPHRTARTRSVTTPGSQWDSVGLSGLRPNAAGNSPQFLCQIIGLLEGRMIGALEGVYGIPGFNRASEQLLTFSGRNFRVFQNVFRSTGRDFMSLEEV